ncbi:hypothetical protein [Sphingomonas sp. Ag1]|jgi:hypothetical protein|uniref:hypothetical protein n=1 Tax=Sphingomonas sp. Ag1 TaxID=1642949 RepID=UPI0006224F34|nr:hypothetical protein [Sphingomonas sp. Ag1]KKI22554.1 hypothetical protein XM50_00520 [Sphingomonas sp. Ag1]
MVEIRDIELRSYSTAAEGSLVFNRIWQLRLADGTPITREIGEAYFVVLDEGRTKLKLSLGNGLTWDDASKSILIQITNEQVRFIRDDTTMEYAFYIVPPAPAGEIIPIREGAVNALRVA